MKHPLITKLVALGAVAILLLIGLGQIEDVVRDRQRYRSMTAQGVANSLAGPQTLVGPMIHSACVESWDAETGKGEERRTTEQRREWQGPIDYVHRMKPRAFGWAIESLAAEGDPVWAFVDSDTAFTAPPARWRSGRSARSPSPATPSTTSRWSA